ncbi:MAG: S1 RNA-binding domain-containing protein, partial [Nitrospinaceae bacterium]
DPDQVVKIGDKVKAKVIKVDTNSKKIALSIKAFEENLDLKAIELEQAEVENFKENE